MDIGDFARAHVGHVHHDIKRVSKLAVALSVAWLAFVVAVAAGALGFVGWVIVKLMQHFGVIAVMLALTATLQAATPEQNLQAIERLTERQQASIERAAVPAVHVAAPAPKPQPKTTIEMTPEQVDAIERHEAARPWVRVQRPMPGAVRVRDGWLISRDAFRESEGGFYRPLTADEANRLR